VISRDPEPGRHGNGGSGFGVWRQGTYLMPARMKLWTNWRWNRRKATSNGPEVRSVAAVMIDQSMP